MNTYLIFGLENYLIKEKLEEIKKSNNIEEDDIVNYNLDNDTISSVLVEASTVSMFSNKKMIICENSSFLTASKSLSDSETLELSNYLENPFDDVVIVFVVKDEKLDQRKKITKLVSKVSKVYDCNKIESYRLSNYIKDYIISKGYSISSSSIDLIISKVGYELSNIIKELDKMFIYKLDDKKITKEDVLDVITNNIENNIFELTNAIVNKEKDKVISIYNDLIKSGEDPIKLIVTISNQFRLMLQVKIMRNSGYSEKEIVSILKEHPYRISIAMKSNYNVNDIKKILLKLSSLDYDIVTGNKDKFFGFEMFLLDL
ncbi:MAG: DNA polymerase III subunit delta [Bacilli bacterium]|nr:DNA polymerase III subunit delta [Bacilli bacterium]